MNTLPNTARIAALIGEPARAAMLMAVSDGRALPAGELARLAAISTTSASGHLAKLVDGGLLVVEQEGRHRYYRLADLAVASVLEELARLAGAPKVAAAPPRGPGVDLRYARSCYDHLAGELGVRLATFLEDEGLLASAGAKRLSVTDRGEVWFRECLEIDATAIRPGAHGIACRCLDWTERRHHLAGPLGAKVFSRLQERHWVRRTAGSRVIALTPGGREGLRALGVPLT